MSRILRLTLCEDCDIGFYSPNRGVQKRCPACQRLHNKKVRWANYKRNIAKRAQAKQAMQVAAKKREHPIPPPTRHQPGTSNKIEVLTQRAEKNQELWNEEDARLDFSTPY